MSAQEIRERVFAVGVADWDRTLFDALIPLPRGTSYNSYVVRGSEKTALIDTVEPGKSDVFFENLSSLELESIDYVVCNHAEQDHSGLLPEVLRRYPEAKVVSNSKCQEFLQAFLDVPGECFTTIKDRDELSLGDRTLEFIFAPWVHWPETMLTYLREDKVLFSCDLFGSHMASKSLYASGEPDTLKEARRYYAQIMMPFARQIRKHLENLQAYDLGLIAPSHGPVYDDPAAILESYSDWVSDKVQNKVVLLYITMHGSTESMVRSLSDALSARDIPVSLFDMESADIGELALDALDAATLVIASPNVLNGAHPNIVYATFLLNSLKPKTRYAALIGSYSWSNKAPDQIEGLLGGLKVEFLTPVFTKGHPDVACIEELNALAETIANKHRGLEG